MSYFHPKLGYQETFLAKEHAEAGHDVYVVTSDRYCPFVYPANKELLGSRIVGSGPFIEEGIKVLRLKTLFEIHYQPWMLGLEKKIQELKPDIVIAYGIVSFCALKLARLKKKKQGAFKLIYTESMTYENSNSTIMKMLYPLFRWVYSSLIQKEADAMVAILRETKVFMNRKLGIPLERIIIIPLGADDKLFSFDSIARNKIRQENCISANDRVFIFTGKITSIKHLPLLIRATASLMTNHNNIKVMLVGSGHKAYVEKLKQDIKKGGLEDKFIWHKVVPNSDLPKFYSAADVAVLPFGASISLREAMACGLPIIISEASTVTELVDYNNGLLFQSENYSSLAQQMEKLLDPRLIKEMGDKSRRFIEEKFTWKMIARQFVELVYSPSREMK